MKKTLLANIMTRGPVTLPQDACLGDAARALAEAHISSILVRGNEGIVGIITEQDMVRAYGNNLAEDTPLWNIMSSPVLSATESMEFREAYELMSSKGVRHLLVVTNDDLPVGIVSQSDFERHLSAAYYRRLKDVQAVMQHSLPTLAPQATIAEAVFAMAENHSNCIVVVDKGRPLGLLTERDVVRLYHNHATRQAPLAGVMTLNPICINAHTSVTDAAQLMHEHSIRHLPVLDERGQLVGLVTEADMLKRLGQELLEITGKEQKQVCQQLAQAEARWQAIFHQASQFMGILDGEGRLLEANHSALALIGITREQVLGQYFWNTPWWRHDEAQKERLRQAINTTISGGMARFEATHPSLDGTLHWVSFQLRRLDQEDGCPLRLLAEGVDITERHLAEASLRMAAGVFSHSHDAVLITDASGVIMDVNPAFSRLMGYTRDESVGRHARLLNSGHHNEAFFEQMFRQVRTQGAWHGELINRRKDGSAVMVLMTLSAIQDEKDQVSQYVGIFSDITDRKAHEHRLEQLAHYDPLTGLPNRSLLMDRLNQSLAHARRRNSRLSVAYLDLDGFKQVNDLHGHHTGDRLLVEVAARLKGLLRSGDTAARLGGDEFVLLINDLGSISELETIMSRVLDSLVQPFLTLGHKLHISASIGVTLFPDDGVDGDVLLRHADHAMYEAKRRGQNRYFLFDVAQDQMARELRELVTEVRKGLQQKEFQLHYQPKVNLCSGIVIGAEALLRWQKPGEDRLRLPGSFLPQLSTHEVMEEIGQWVLEEALAQMRLWQQQGLELAISVNLSPRQIQSAHFVDKLRNTLAAFPEVKPSQLELEVVESAALDDLIHTGQVMTECQTLGVTFSLDDFGTGYSSLAYFKNLPASTLKIDQTFVRDMLREPEALAIVEGVLGLTNAFQRNAVAEGVESTAHGTLLVRLGCIQAQGYAIARPMPADELPDWVLNFTPEQEWMMAAEEQWRHEDFPLIAAEVEHRHWKEKVENLLNRDGDGASLPEIPDQNQCRLGRWLSGSGSSNYSHLDIFQQLVGHHDQMHNLVSQLISEKPLTADRLNAFRQSSLQVLDDLSLLQQAVSRLRQSN